MALGVALTGASLWPMSQLLAAVAQRDWLGALLLLAVTWLLARSGVELAASAQASRAPKP